jgi:hypothetical protein
MPKSSFIKEVGFMLPSDQGSGRRELSHIILTLAWLAGLILSACSTADPPPDQIFTDTAKEEQGAVPEATHPVQPEIDLREANVMNVEVVALAGRNFRFNVTLLHDDEGEAPNFADFWQVEDVNGRVLGKRILLHSHSNQPFTRSEVIEIPEEIDVVIVRGHDMVHGFGGQAMKVDLKNGRMEAFEDIAP